MGIDMSYTSSTLDPNDWEALGDAWQRFTTQNPHLGLSPSEAAAGRFARKHYQQFADQGVMLKGILGKYLAHREGFPNAAFALIVSKAA